MGVTDQTDHLCHVELLGPLRITCAGKTHSNFATQKSAALAAYLALHIGPHPRERIVDLLWSEMELSAGRNNLSTTLVSLRRQMEPPGVRRGSVLVTSQAEVGLNPETVTSDAAVFEDLSRRAARTESPQARVELLTRAVNLHRGDVLAGNYQDWALRAADRLRTRLQSALSQLARDQEALESYEDALETAQRSEALDPYSEEIHCRLVSLYVRTGQLARARERHDKFVRLLADEYGAELSDDSLAAISRIFSQPAPAARTQSGSAAAIKRAGGNALTTSFLLPEAIAAPIVLPVTLGGYYGREAEIVNLVRTAGAR